MWVLFVLSLARVLRVAMVCYIFGGVVLVILFLESGCGGIWCTVCVMFVVGGVLLIRTQSLPATK